MKYYNIKDIEVYRTGKVHFIRGKIMKPLTIQENKLKEEMKERCLAKGQYIDEKAKDKFKMLCHLEDFEVQYWELQQENKQLKENWNKLKEWVNKYYDYYTNEKDYIGGRLCFTDMKNKIQELEQGSDE